MLPHGLTPAANKLPKYDPTQQETGAGGNVHKLGFEEPQQVSGKFVKGVEVRRVLCAVSVSSLN